MAHFPLPVRNAFPALLVAAIVAGLKEGPRDAPIATQMETAAHVRPATTRAATSAIQRKATDHPPPPARNARLASLVAAIVAGLKEGPRDAPIATQMETAAHVRPATTRAATSAIQRKATDHPPPPARNARLASLVAANVAGPKEGPQDAPVAIRMATVQRARLVTQKQAINATLQKKRMVHTLPPARNALPA